MLVVWADTGQFPAHATCVILHGSISGGMPTLTHVAIRAELLPAAARGRERNSESMTLSMSEGRSSTESANVTALMLAASGPRDPATQQAGKCLPPARFCHQPLCRLPHAQGVQATCSRQQQYPASGAAVLSAVGGSCKCSSSNSKTHHCSHLWCLHAIGAPPAASQVLEVYYGAAEDRGGRQYMQVRCS